jgi:DnaK suppressor protein
MINKPKAKQVKKDSVSKFEPIRKILENQRNTLLKEVMLSLDPVATPGIQTFSDLGDQASAESDRNFYIRLKEREQKLIKKIDAALDQIENGTFGICEGCGKEIGLKRLKARPVATLCIKCKTEAEKEEKARNL